MAPFSRRMGLISLLLLAFLVSLAPLPVSAAPPDKLAGQVPAPLEFGSGAVYVIPLSGTMDAGMNGFLRRSLQAADAAGAAAVILEVRTLGGLLSAALDARDLLDDTTLPVITFVRQRAWSAGVVLALAADRIAMAPGASLGAAEPRPPDEKIISAWEGELRALAVRNGRDPLVAAAMVDRDLSIAGVVEAGKLLTLETRRAAELGYADLVATDRQALMGSLGLGDRPVVEVAPSPWERFARFATGPLVAPVLLAVGVLGLLVELFLPGIGLPGGIGVTSLALYFAAHMAAGFSGWEALLLFLTGIVLLAVEFVVPGFGFFGVVGLVTMGFSIFLASPSPQRALVSLALTLAVSIAAIIVLLRKVGPHGFWRKLFLYDRQERDQGYVAPADREELVNKTGLAVSPLRPAGVVDIDGRRVDCVSEGGFVAAGCRVRVVTVEGPRLVVRPVAER